MFQTLTNGLYTPTLHRVLNTDPARSRVTIQFLDEPPFEATIAPLPQLVAAAACGAAANGVGRAARFPALR
ncbi:hypothetical protein MNEG_9486 [Monoraphidium neglectum]|uniref:Isopenicillin N synthase-like Fe(2+) 2OG dioxygenase domain-containing protein n=1 Tax=Monoraphidium neglectum TaxID=145388 RepID=A0A0D2MCC3_9CHLO|nr:hypothetical protein MNEG_9486 [Monoraphidium neglectum]KIY98476.1 hypothetical protein MNEG_9486 [Monoraphidium neglectum]|eukprot:XP_013897496.1 hypothetical protein MNEG_9486 [Monoraphidium neglectum]